MRGACSAGSNRARPAPNHKGAHRRASINEPENTIKKDSNQLLKVPPNKQDKLAAAVKVLTEYRV